MQGTCALCAGSGEALSAEKKARSALEEEIRSANAKVSQMQGEFVRIRIASGQAEEAAASHNSLLGHQLKEVRRNPQDEDADEMMYRLRTRGQDDVCL